MTQSTTAPTKRLLEAIKDGTHGTFARLATGGRPFLSAKNVMNGQLVVGEDESLISELDFNSITSNGFPRLNDVLLTIVGTIGRTCLFSSSVPMAFQRSVAFLRPNISTSPSYLSYLLQSGLFQQQLELATKSAAQGGVYMGDVWNATCTFVTGRTAQERIANFLDEKTARIDALIAAKESLSHRMSELYQAEVTYLVTRGVLPGVELKPTGHPAISEIPDGWILSRVKWACTLVRDGTHQPPARVEQGVPLLSVRNLQAGEFNFLPDDSKISEADFLELNRSFDVRQNDVLLAVVGATMGKVAVVGEMDGPFHIQRSLALLRPRLEMLSSELLAAQIGADFFQKFLWQNTGFSAQPGTYLGELANFPVLVPPPMERRKIVDLLKEKKVAFNTMRVHVKTHIDRLREYRSSLISAAVTGQLNIDDSGEA